MLVRDEINCLSTCNWLGGQAGYIVERTAAGMNLAINDSEAKIDRDIGQNMG